MSTIDDETIHELLKGDRGMKVLLEPILSQILQAGMTDWLAAGNLRFPSLVSVPMIGSDTETGVIYVSFRHGSARSSWTSLGIGVERLKRLSSSAVSGA